MAAFYTWVLPTNVDFRTITTPIIIPYNGCTIVNKINPNKKLSGYVSIEDYSSASIAVTISLSERTAISLARGECRITVSSNTIASDPVLLIIDCEIGESSELNNLFPTTFIINKCKYTNGEYSSYIPMIYRNEKNNSENTGRPYELRTFTEHHHPVQLDYNTKYTTFSNDNNEEYESSMLGSKLYASDIKVIDLTNGSIDLDLPNGNKEQFSDNYYKSSIGLSISSTLDNYIDRNILEEGKYSSKLAIERIIFMSNRINVLGNTIDELKLPTKIKDEFILSSNMLEPSKENELRKLSAVKPEKLANFFVGAKRIDSNEITLESVVSLLEIYETSSLESNIIKVNLLTDESVLVVTNHSNHDFTDVNKYGVDLQLYYNNTQIDTVHVKLGNCDSIYVNLNNNPQVQHYHITEQCVEMHYDSVIRTDQELLDFIEGNSDTYTNCHSILIKKNEDADNNGMYFYHIFEENGYSFPYIPTIALEDDVFIANTEVTIHPKTKVINYRGYCSFQLDKYEDTSVLNGNGLLYYNYGKYDIVISSQKQLDDFLIYLSGSSTQTTTFDNYKNKIIFIDRNHDTISNDLRTVYSITSGGKMSPSDNVKALYNCRALYMNSYVYMSSPADTRLFFAPSNGVYGYISVAVNGFNCDSSGYTPINTELNSTTKAHFYKTGMYYNTKDWSIKPYGSDIWYSGKWLINYKDLATITGITNYFKVSLESINVTCYKSKTDGTIDTSNIATIKEANSRMKFSYCSTSTSYFSDFSWYADVGSNE